MNDEQQLRIEAMKLAAQLIRDYKLKDNLILCLRKYINSYSRKKFNYGEYKINK